MKEKIYVVSVKDGDDCDPTVLLVRALTRAGAERHVRGRLQVSAELASQQDLVSLLQNGAFIIGDET